MYTGKDDTPHPPTDHPRWQESVVLAWWAEEAGVGGFHRIGHEVNQGVTNYWLGVVTRDGKRFRGDARSELRADERTEDSFAVAGVQRCWYDGSHVRWEVTQPGLELDLTVDDWYPMSTMWEQGAAGRLESDMAAEHYEASGPVTGRARVGDDEYEIVGVQHRDHSWGPRYMEIMRNYRWVPFIFGPDLAGALTTVQMDDGTVVRTGYVWDGETIERTLDTDVVVFVEADGITMRGGWARASFPRFGELSLTGEVLDGVLSASLAPTAAVLSTACTATLHDGRVGWADFETCNNARAGTAEIMLTLAAAGEHGLSYRDPGFPERFPMPFLALPQPVGATGA